MRRVYRTLCLLTFIIICACTSVNFILIVKVLQNENLIMEFMQQQNKNKGLIMPVQHVNKHVFEDRRANTTVEISSVVTGARKDGDVTLRKMDDSFHSFNTSTSDLIDVQRIIPDARNEACQRKVYRNNLPKASVVIIFRDEWPSVLIRTVYSALNNTPPSLLREIILVDDGSIDDKLRLQLKTHFYGTDKIKLLTNLKPLGLMMARQRGIDATLSEYFIVMDCHMEFSKGWLEPLLDRLLENPRSLLSANLGNIDDYTFNVKFNKKDDISHFITFDPLTLGQLWADYSPAFKHQRNKSFDPVPVGAVQGGFIAMKKDFFIKLGGFDPGMKQWGSEQFEISFKVWMCGGMVENVPCSHVAHLYRHTPWGATKKTDDFLAANAMRVLEVWVDDPHKRFIREAIGQNSQYDIGDLTHRHKLRKENNCHGFQYFIDKLKTFSDVYVLDNIKAKGEIRNKKWNKCLSVIKYKPKKYRIEIHSCKNSGKQYFILTERNQVRTVKGNLLQTKPNKKFSETVDVFIEPSPSRQYIEDAVWQYRNDNSLCHTATKKCLTVVNANVFRVETCNGSPEQQWFWNRL